MLPPHEQSNFLKSKLLITLQIQKDYGKPMFDYSFWAFFGQMISFNFSVKTLYVRTFKTTSVSVAVA